MILRSEVTKQYVDVDRRELLRKEIVMTPGQPIGMVRKRPVGEAPTRGAVLLVHGFGQNRYTWHVSKRSYSNYLAAAGYDVFNADLRGHGRSLKYDGARASRIADFIEHDIPQCIDEVLKLSGHQRVFLVGHSMGGLICTAAASGRARGKVAGIITLGSPYSFGEGSRMLDYFSKLLMGLRATGVLDRNFHVPLGFLGNHLRKRIRVWDSPKFRFPIRPWRPGSVEHDILDEYLQRSFDFSNIHVAFDIFSGSHRKSLIGPNRGLVDYARAFQSLKIPLLIVAGSHDDLAPPRSVRVAYEVSGSDDKTYREFPCGHVDIIMGKEAVSTVWPLCKDWLDERALLLGAAPESLRAPRSVPAEVLSSEPALGVPKGRGVLSGERDESV